MSLTPELLTQFGLLGKVRTGHPTLDAVLCLLLPLFLRWAQPRLNLLSLRAVALLRRWWSGEAGRSVVVRVIEHVAYEDGYYYDPDGEPANAILQQALLSYINNCDTASASTVVARPTATHTAAPGAAKSPMKVLQDMTTAYLTLEKRRRRLATAADDAGSDSETEDSSAGGSKGSSCGSSVSAAKQREAAAYGLNLTPPVRQWQGLGNGVEFMRYTYVHSASTEKRRRIGSVIKLRSLAPDGARRVSDLLTAALQDHRFQKAARPADRHRYLYVPTCLDPPAALSGPAPAGAPSAGGDGRVGNGGGGKAAPTVAAMFKRYRLSSEKTFASFFHPGKEELLHLVTQFEDRQGRFAVPGYPQKLGLLLYGPPGTGKTSLIKALAQRTGRSVVSVPLARISTNQQLMDIMFDTRVLLQRRQTSGGGSGSKRSNGDDDNDHDDDDGSGSDSDDEGGTAITLPFNKVIYVLEDVDAAGGVVMRRSRSQPAAAAAAALAVAASSAATAAAASSTCGSDCASIATSTSTPASSALSSMDGDDVAPSDRSLRRRCPTAAAKARGAAAPGPDTAPDITWARGNPTSTHATTTISAAPDTASPSYVAEAEAVALAAALAESLAGTPSTAAAGYAAAARYSSYGSYRRRHNDEVNLAGILNVLDGAVDTPGRIVILTTNCPDSLDPALIRPGRINKVLYLGRLRLAEAAAMMRHYCFPQQLAAAGANGGRPASGVGAGGGDGLRQEGEAAARRREAEAALAAVWMDDVLSPAQLEALCGEADTWRELVQAVEAEIGSVTEGWNQFERC